MARSKQHKRPSQRKLTTKAIVKQVGTRLDVEAPYNSNFVAQINHDIPKLAKDWLPDIPCTDATHHGCKGRWRIALSYKEQLLAALQAFYPIVVITDTNGTRTMKWYGVV